MKSVRTEHTFDCTPDEFWEVFFNDDIMNGVMRKIDILERVVRKDEDDGLIRERAIYQKPERDLPGPLKKVAGGDVSYVEEQRYDKKAGRMEFTVNPAALSGKIKVNGTMVVVPEGQNRCRRTMEATVKVDAFMIGGIAEGFIAGQVKDGYDNSAPHMATAIREWKKGKEG